MKNIIFLGGYFLNEKVQEYVDNSNGGIQFAASKLQMAFIDGLSELNQSLIWRINLPYIGSYPRLYKKVYLSRFSNPSDPKLYMPGFINIKGIKLFHKFFKSFGFLVKVIFKNDRSKDINIVVYGVHTPFLLASVLVKFIFRVKIFFIMTDLPIYMNEKPDFLHKYLKKIDNFVIYSLTRLFDGSVMLTNAMIDNYGLDNGRNVLIEGIHLPIIPNVNSSLSNYSNFHFVLYSGTLDYRYGILDLLNASNYFDSSIKLVIIGDGNAKKDISDNIYRNIIYLGSLPNDQVIYLQSISSVLINPRREEGEYTKYSFPSKTIEYLSSGVPFFGRRLSGIPDEYYQFINLIESNDPIYIARQLNFALNNELDSLIEKAKLAKNFIISEKSIIKQVSKLYNILS